METTNIPENWHAGLVYIGFWASFRRSAQNACMHNAITVCASPYVWILKLLDGFLWKIWYFVATLKGLEWIYKSISGGRLIITPALRKVQNELIIFLKVSF
jgi:hypothetical protein